MELTQPEAILASYALVLLGSIISILMGLNLLYTKKEVA
jgi:hypothetical protein